jgi:hypothetical protein
MASPLQLVHPVIGIVVSLCLSVHDGLKGYTMNCRTITLMCCRDKKEQTTLEASSHTNIIVSTYSCNADGKNVQRSCLICWVHLTFPSSAKSSPVFPNASQDSTIGVTHAGTQCLDTSTIIRANLGNIDDCPHAWRKGITHAFAQFTVQDQSTVIVKDMRSMLSNMHASFAGLVDEFWCLSSAACHVELWRITKILENSRVLLSLLQSQWSICWIKPCRVFETVDSSRISTAWREEASKKPLRQRDEEMETTT